MTHMENSTGAWDCVVLAAGRGSRMNTTLAKALHPIAGKKMILYALDAVVEAGFPSAAIVRDPSNNLPDALGSDAHRFVIQDSPDGTGGALRTFTSIAAADASHVLVLNADAPLIEAATLQRLRQAHESQPGAAITLLAANVSHSSDAGRVIRSGAREIEAIIEASDLRYDAAVTEVNIGAYAFDATWLRTALPRLTRQDNGEYYLTELVSLSHADGLPIQAIEVGDESEGLGINTLVDLSRAERIIRRRTLEALMLSGVTIQDPESTYIDATASIQPDAVIRHNTHIYGNTTIGADSEIGPDAHIVDSDIAHGCVIRSSSLEGVILESGVTVGPYARLRPGTHLGQEVHIGSFGEVKASRLGRGTAMGHFGYVGDSHVGEDVNIGAGAVTCNFDGTSKHPTNIGNGAFIGSGTMMVAPVTIGAQAYTGAGAIVTRNVGPGVTVTGAPARPRE